MYCKSCMELLGNMLVNQLGDVKGYNYNTLFAVEHMSNNKSLVRFNSSEKYCTYCGVKIPSEPGVPTICVLGTSGSDRLIKESCKVVDDKPYQLVGIDICKCDCDEDGEILLPCAHESSCNKDCNDCPDYINDAMDDLECSYCRGEMNEDYAREDAVIEKWRDPSSQKLTHTNCKFETSPDCIQNCQHCVFGTEMRSTRVTGKRGTIEELKYYDRGVIKTMRSTHVEDIEDKELRKEIRRTLKKQVKRELKEIDKEAKREKKELKRLQNNYRRNN